MRIEHILPRDLVGQRALRILIVGAGGTGSAIVMGLPYLDQAMRVWGRSSGLEVVMMDADTVSETNCVRQPFSISDIGQNKATVLINRINLFWGTRWRAEPANFHERTLDRSMTPLSTSCRLCGHARGTRHHRAGADEDQKPHSVLARSRQQRRQRPVRSWPAIERAQPEESRPAADRERTVSRDHRR